MNWLNNTFFFRLFRTDKLLFAGVGLYIVCTLYYALHQREEFPFFLFGMYSLKEEPQPVYTSYSIFLGGQEIKYSKLRDPQREVISSTIAHAAPLIEAHKIDSTDELKLKNWLMDYCFDRRLMGENRMDVYRLSCTYDSTGKVNVANKQLVYSYASE